MAQDQGSGEKTEPATPKRLRDARKRGDVAKSREMGSTLGLAFTSVLIIFAMSTGIERLTGLLIDAVSYRDLPFETLARQMMEESVEIFLIISAIILLPVALFGLLLEFLQTGPIFALEKIQPKLSNLDPAAGIKKMFSMDNFVELIKTLAKTVILAIIAWFTISAVLSELAYLPAAEPMTIVVAIRSMLIDLFGWTLGIFLGITALDTAYQHHAYAKKMKMSIADIKKEHKDNEGDPMLKGQRRQLQQEWSQESSNQAARTASVLVVNPTHIAIAIKYDKDDAPIPLVTAKAQDENARAMREEANRAFVPVLRNQQLARRLLNDVDEGDAVPRELFDMVAEIILWARETSEKLNPHNQWHTSTAPKTDALLAPGEDLSAYPPTVELFAHHSSKPGSAPT